MRFSIRIASGWQPLFSLFGFKPDASYVAIEDGVLELRFGTAHERVPLADIERVEPRRWPFFYGLGPKLDVKDGVAYVGSTQGVVRIWLKRPIPMNVWGPFRRGKTHAVTVSLHDPDGFMAALGQAQGAA